MSSNQINFYVNGNKVSVPTDSDHNIVKITGFDRSNTVFIFIDQKVNHFGSIDASGAQLTHTLPGLEGKDQDTICGEFCVKCQKIFAKDSLRNRTCDKCQYMIELMARNF